MVRVHAAGGFPVAEQAARGAGRGGDDGQHQQDPAREHLACARGAALPAQRQTHRGAFSFALEADFLTLSM
ncbi:hypothetical protein TNCV_3654781 [Trichonephila clavipes]|nr:hypothetical protein TNCV_3654781 [Trichonephila clavipes]